MATKVILLVAFAGFILPAIARGDNAPALTGSNAKITDALAQSDAVFVGQVKDIGFGDFKAKGGLMFRGVQVNVLQVLRGAVGASVTVTLGVVGIAGFHEDPPTTGNSYIFFVLRKGAPEADPYDVLKLLKATDVNIASVKKLVAQSHAK